MVQRYDTYTMLGPPLARSVGHPRRHSVGAEAGGEAQAGAAHGEIADQIPQQRRELHEGRDQGEEGAVELSCAHRGQQVPRAGGGPVQGGGCGKRSSHSPHGRNGRARVMSFKLTPMAKYSVKAMEPK